MKRKYKGWLIFIVGLLCGFIIASHWQGGRKFIQDISPLYNKKVNQGVQQLGTGIIESGQKVKEKIVD